MAAVQESFDHVIVGAGSAGAVLAGRLSADPGTRVLLLEAGPEDSSWTIRMPTAVTINIPRATYNWRFWTEPEPALQGRRLYQPRGKVLGGSSSLNGMIAIRGHALDYDRWVEEGAPGWSYAEVLPYFRRLESHATRRDAYHGTDGPVRIVPGTSRNPLYAAFIEAGVQAGYPRTEDVNGFRQEGFGPFDMTIDAGVRASSSHAYLRPARGRPNLTIRTLAQAIRVVVERGRAVGVDYLDAGRARTVRAEREVIVCGGAFSSPHLLLLSGIGPADELRRTGVAVVHDLPGVGRNLHDHVEVHVDQACTKPITLYGALRPWNQALIGLRWLLSHGGPGATNHYEAGAFLRSRAGVRHPDIQIHFVPICYSSHHDRRAVEHGYRVHVGQMRPTSRGSVTLASADPLAHPRIVLNALATEEDWRTTRACLEIGREVLAQRAFDPFRGPERQPGPDARDPAAIDAYIRATAVSAYHPCGGCRMGTGPDAVTDHEGRVHGIEALRVVDASIMPSVVSGNTNLPIMMMAEKIAASIRGEPPLSPVHLPVHEAPNWRERQR
jgi:choline dehydrogenase